ncbi:MAG: PilZ domain-containing protein [Thermodesulfovibrionales bacterium]|nr:PilZ domain-containing protein [Thermodesulfovibrionales bacterium]
MKKIIIPQDIKAFLEKEQCFLDRSDMTIFTTSDNEEVLALHRIEKADLIIAKLDTPRMNGESLCSLIRDDKKLCRVSILIVCSGTKTETERCLQCRANSYITTPINNATLLVEIHQLLNIAPRKALRIPMSIKIHVTSKGGPFTGYGENISVSGMLLHTETLLADGDTLTCSFYLPDSTHITTNAEVMRLLERTTEHDTNGYGIKFIDLSAGFHSAIERFIGKRI